MTYSSSAADRKSRLRVLYLTDSLDAPYRYRCENACLQLRRSAIADVATIFHPEVLRLIPAYSVLVLFRLPWSEKVAQIVEVAERHKVTLVFDIDDLIFTENSAQQLTFLASADAYERCRYEMLSARLRETMHHCPYFLGSTTQLVREAEREGRRAFCHPNLLHPETLQAAGWARWCKPWLRQRNIISYFSGSNTHDLDLQSIAPVIRDVLAEHPEVQFLLGGFAQVPEALSEYRSRIIQAPFVDWRVLPWLQAMSLCNLAPLAERNAFSHAKSALKFFEAAIVDVPSAATPTAPMRRAINDGVNGFLPESPSQWRNAIEQCLDRAQSARIGRAARRSAIQDHTVLGYSGILHGILESMVNPDWRPTQEPLPVALDFFLTDVPGKRSAELQPNRQEQRAWIRRILSAARNPEKLHTPHAYRPETRVLCAVDQVTDQPAHGAALHFAPIQQLEPIAADQFRVTGTDPFLMTDDLPGNSADVEYFEVTLRFESPEPAALAQLYWTTDRHPNFGEQQSIRFVVPADGQQRTYQVRLTTSDTGERTNWPSGEKLRVLRFDPVNAPGVLTLSAPRLLDSARRPVQSGAGVLTIGR